VLAWTLADKIFHGKPTTLGAASGAVAGLVAITPAAGFVGPLSAIIIGFVAGIVCFLAIMIKEKLGYDDSLDVVAVHGVGGFWGALATGLFASIGAQGLFFGNPRQLAIQALAALTVMVFSFVVSSIILLVLKKTIGLRVSEEDELQGLDLSQHGETGYYLW
jgi:ammonium transporter, Amt family